MVVVNHAREWSKAFYSREFAENKQHLLVSNPIWRNIDTKNFFQNVENLIELISFFNSFLVSRSFQKRFQAFISSLQNDMVWPPYPLAKNARLD